ncbi:MAG: DNA-directed RNA polymerase subunit omega, partial [Planctomycetia bacterium]
MLDELREDALVARVGGRYKLTTLIQKRIIGLNNGARPLVNMRTDDKLAVVLEEIKQGKIFLDNTGVLNTLDDHLLDTGEIDEEDL